MIEQATEAEPRHGILARALTDEFVSVSLPAAGRMTDDRATVFVTTGGRPARVRISLDEQHHTWQIADRHHAHELPLDTPVPDVVELVAVCFAKRCSDVPVLAIQLS